MKINWWGILFIPFYIPFGFFFATHRGKWWVKGYWEEYVTLGGWRTFRNKTTKE